KQLIETYNIKAVYTNHDYEPYAKKRDAEIKLLLEKHHVTFKTYKDQVIFEKNELVKSDGKPYVVYTPYMRLWKATFKTITLEYFNFLEYSKNLIKNTDLPNISLEEMGFIKSTQMVADYKVNSQVIQQYEATRNFPSLDATSNLGPHWRFGTVSLRDMVRYAT